ncbi:MAG: cation:proton antiporter [Bacteroidetes bacterium]|nr:cation:proton antiporter [Bacteroidota bacterium]HET6245840.1 cation:proton antiporter [Bacteroidia bacterium]
MGVLQNFIILLLTAVGVLVILSRLKVPSVIGFLLTGILIGTVGSGYIKAGHELEVMAEVGVILLMFTIGLEFSISRMNQMKRQVLIYGGMQVLITILTVWIILFFTGFSTKESIFAAFVISLSSTAIVMKIMQDKGKLQTPDGRIMLGILLFQDLCIVPLIILTPLLGTVGEVDALEVLLKLAGSFGLILIIFLSAKYLLPKIFDYVINSRVSEIFILLIIGLAFGLALLTYSLGFSVALGAFIAGMILAESDFIHQIEADIKPLKTLFLSVFFITVGMLMDVDYLIANPIKILLVLAGILILKTIIITSILFFSKNPINISLKSGLGLSQIGEFAFMLLSIAHPLDIISEDFYQLFLSVSVISMLITPLLLILGEKLRTQQGLMKKVDENFIEQKEVIIAGFGINGINLSRIFKALNISYRIIDMNPATVRKFKEAGEPIVFGDITQLENLKRIGIEKATMLVIAISDAEATQKAIDISRKNNPDLQIIVRSEFISQIENLYDLGANMVISQDFEASLQIASYVLKFFGIAEPIAKIKSDQLRKRHYRFFTEDQAVENQLKIAELADIEFFNETYLAIENPGLIGKKVIKINSQLMQVFKKARIIGLIREDIIITEFGEDIKVERLDTLVVFGTQDKLDMAVEYLDNFT